MDIHKHTHNILGHNDQEATVLRDSLSSSQQVLFRNGQRLFLIVSETGKGQGS